VNGFISSLNLKVYSPTLLIRYLFSIFNIISCYLIFVHPLGVHFKNFVNNNIKLQNFYNRSDVRGGSTLGNISNSHVSLISADIGIGQLAMHSNYELAGVKDTLDMIRFISSFYSEDVIKEGNTLSISKE